MTPRRIAMAAAAVAAIGLVLWIVASRRSEAPYLSGYVEGDSLFLSASVAGTVASVSVVQGQRVQAGQRLFAIEPATLSAQSEQAIALEAQAQTSISAAQAIAQQALAEVAAAAAQARRAQQDLARVTEVRRADRAAVADREVDAANAELREADARLAAARETAASRRAQLASARAQAAGTQGGVHEVRIRLGQLAPAAPAQGRVQEVFFQAGEWVAANQPVISLLPDDKVKIRFFVPQADVMRYGIGQVVRFSCDGCARGLSARIDYVSPTPEFTPPVIYSREARDRMVFMVEAAAPARDRLMPGLPVDVVPIGDGK